MALTASIDTTGPAPVLTVNSGDDRKLEVVVKSAGETVTATGVWPVTVTDDSGAEWVQDSDDGSTAVYHRAAPPS